MFLNSKHYSTISYYLLLCAGSGEIFFTSFKLTLLTYEARICLSNSMSLCADTDTH